MPRDQPGGPSYDGFRGFLSATGAQNIVFSNGFEGVAFFAATITCAKKLKIFVFSKGFGFTVRFTWFFFLPRGPCAKTIVFQRFLWGVAEKNRLFFSATSFARHSLSENTVQPKGF